jgi:predicted branched-subunit amino acid permease
MIDATGMPALVLFASMVGYGSMAHEAGLTLWTAVASTGLTWGLPGQIAMVELYALGAPVIAIVAASSAANARFLPMVLSVMPLFNEALPRKRWRYLVAQFMSLNPWAAIMRRGPAMKPADRPPYYAGFAGVCVTAAVIGTGVGFVVSGALSTGMTLTLIFLNPVFFTLVFADARGRASIMAVLAGVVAGPLFHLLSPDWGLLLTGVVAGTAVYLVDRQMRQRHG